ncbi:Potassium voltage-gated channel subfamily V member 2 [Collichthys lucidus]|uniref:Potassium voltage-gated channel subfamily V member 2 n=1 Tax=Collichthys lucidus TaxID=240159 RepID=A0A4V6ANX0_COLLU|nr:Potassium voltage-gated channel subfamily V member 2 [Collichthys lucidus]
MGHLGGLFLLIVPLTCHRIWGAAGHTRPSCTEQLEFRCSDGSCIPKLSVCDGRTDCEDGSDEDHCAVNRCPPGNQLCDKRTDCKDGRDDSGRPCGLSPPHPQTSPTCTASDFQCGDGQCVPQAWKCDNSRDCSDGSDEENCAQNECEVNNGGCSHECFDLPMGFLCICPDNMRQVDDTHCEEVDACLESDVCDQLCVHANSSLTCDCHKDYQMNPTTRECKAKGDEAQLVFTSSKGMRWMSITGVENRKPAPHIAGPGPVAVLVSNRTLYWARQGRGSIYRVSMDAKKQNSVSVLKVQGSVSGLAVDWIHQLLYWTNMESGSVNVGLLDDIPRQLLYWLDQGKRSISRVNLEGRQRKTVVESNGYLDRPFGLAVFEGFVYWSEEVMRSISRANKHNGKDFKVLLSNATSPGGMVIVHSVLQPEEDNKTFPFSQEKTFKAWRSLENLDSPGFKADCPKAKDRPECQQSINVNVGGKVFHIPKQYAIKYPQTRIGSLALCRDKAKLLMLCDDYSVCKNEFFFDRDPTFFHHILHFYTSGVLWVIREMCPINFEEEIAYWGLSLKDTQLCCWLVFEERVDDVRDNLKVDRELMAEIEVKYNDECFKDMMFGDVRKSLWNLVEDPYSSTLAKAFTVVSNLFVLFSIVAMTLNTVEELQKYKMNNRTHMEWVEIITIVFFTFEYLIRLVTTPNITMFLKSGLNFVDMVAVMPYFIQIIFDASTDSEDVKGQEDLRTMARVSKVSHVLKIIKLLRIFRILKLARHSTGMRAFGFTLRQCYQQACCIFLFIAMGIFTFSALLHSAERETEGSPITSIPYAWWWAAVSISTVGYGDVVPVTILGRFVAFGCISFGIILNGMPISFLFNKFSDYYAKLKAQEYNTTLVQRRFHLKKRLRRKMDMCFHPSEEDNDSRSQSPQS